ncbi:MAG: helix-turn-helix transcriptional regulator [Acidobacteriota bacterium]
MTSDRLAPPPETTARVERWVDRLRDELRRLVKTSTVSQREIERRANWSRGYLSQVLQGHIGLAVHHVLAVLSALESDPGRFFADVFGDGRPELEDIQRRMARYDAAFAHLSAQGLLGDLEGFDGGEARLGPPT